MLNRKQTIAVAVLMALVVGLGWLDRSQQPPKAVNENQGTTASNYEPGALTPFRIFTSDGLKEITKYCNSYPDNEKKKWPQIYHCDLRITDVYIAVFSGLLVIVTGGIVWVGFQQYRDTRILQRAYISVNPSGLDTDTYGHLIGHVAFENVGHLPARDIFWKIEIAASDNGDNWIPKKLSRSNLEGRAVLPVGAKWKMGSGPCLPRPAQRWEYVFVWGRIEYTDGFNNSRFIEFCHRYPWARQQRVMGIDDYVIPVIVSVDYARFHNTGNDAD